MGLLLVLFLIFFNTESLAQHAQHLAQKPIPSTTNKTQPSFQQSSQKKRMRSAKILLTTGSERCVNLVVSYKWVNFAGKTRRAIAVNDQIPAPTLHFRQGVHQDFHCNLHS